MRIRLRLRRAATLLAALVVTVSVTVVLPAAPAAAHGTLATSVPLADSVVTRPPEQLALYFTEQPHAQAHFTVTDPTGARVEGPWSPGEPKRLDKPVQEYNLVDGKLEPVLYHTGFPAMLPVTHWPAKGRYTATYLSVASDGDQVRGSVVFDYQGPTSAPPPGWTAPTSEPAPALLALLEQGRHDAPGNAGSPQPDGSLAAPSAAAEAADEDGGGLGPWLVPGIVVVVVAVIVVVAARRRSTTPAPTRARPTPKRTTTATRPATRHRPRR
ncbi:hypothetical protein AWW66_17900 [Micromonospora rosaria]|uniref:CopC domain-containing protein n=1 Tax=Micromonospora rosaria TaxID=47874 RepID=A0A136PQD2_9ACTN|nr:copper resistance protein CopC [Micromonospora rosaria]KXK60633.1 hypothetical protein AWW66_17900 [Micromonospora rosaria]